MDKITIVRPERAAKPKLGDILYRAARYLRPLTPEMRTPKQSGLEMIRLDCFEPNPFWGLKYLGIEWLEKGTKYKCPYTGMEFHGILPLAVVTKSTQQYRERLIANKFGEWRLDFVLDFDFHWSHSDEAKKPLQQFLRLNRVERVMLGTCYTSGTLASDGMGCLGLASMPLSNGDSLIVAVWIWYNK